MTAMVVNKRGVLLFCSLLGLGLVACGGAPPSDELLSARRAYKQAERSPARDLVPDQLLTAKQALDEAESAHESEAGSLDERTLAYVAERKARLAVALANIRAAKENINVSNRAYTEALEADRARARGELDQTRTKLSKSQEDLERVACPSASEP